MTDKTSEMDKMMKMQKHFDRNFIKPLIGYCFGQMVIENPLATERKEKTLTYKGHPIIQWLSKYLRFDPNVTVTYNYHRPAAFMLEGRMIVHPAIAKQMRQTLTIKPIV